MMIPVGAFITFEEEEGYQRCLALQDKSKVQILGQRMKVKPATEPTNIIWENRQHTTASRIFKTIFVILVIIFLLAISFSIILLLKQKSRESNSKYAQQSCPELKETFDDQNLKNYAVDEWIDYYQTPKDVYKKSQVSAILDCFCKD